MMRKSILFCLKCYRCMSYFKFEMLIWYDVWFCDDDETFPRVSGMSCKIIKNFVWWKESQPVWRMLITIAFSEFFKDFTDKFFLSYLKNVSKAKGFPFLFIYFVVDLSLDFLKIYFGTTCGWCSVKHITFIFI